MLFILFQVLLLIIFLSLSCLTQSDTIFPGQNIAQIKCNFLSIKDHYPAQSFTVSKIVTNLNMKLELYIMQTGITCKKLPCMT